VQWKLHRSFPRAGSPKSYTVALRRQGVNMSKITAYDEYNRDIIEESSIVRPAIRSLQLADGINHRAALASWGWVMLSELLQCVNNHPKKLHFRPITTAESLFSRFGLLNGMDHNGTALVTWIEPFRCSINCDAFPPRGRLHVLVPSRWANDVINVASMGIVEVFSESRESAIIGRDNRPVSVYVIVGRLADGAKRALYKTSGEWHCMSTYP